MITHFGLFVPINTDSELPKSPIPAPASEDLFLVRRDKEWGIFWSICDEEEVAPEAMSSVAWLLNMAQQIGYAHISPHGYQWGEPVICVVMRESNGSFPNLGVITRHDWTSGTTPPGR